MKRFLILIVLVLAGCAESDRKTYERIASEINSSGAITEEQAEGLSKVTESAKLNGLTSITNAQAEILSKVVGSLELNGLTSMTDAQAESLSRV